ncbi:Abi-alpha family protein [Paraburkholderia sp. SARCC-3016]|uniref:Abi-alpha family protein n=1 Tax=Paraburkholderia sp. SARCC-3016 TaxID=3058611 RepID=UPI002808202F|nr:Abi-alpha family protein [Paraburkholderia sp. SARCC-3016]MDQ7975925.1 Abi-alpha family protein [Paraburkholderia sp. SARCC-3016]
MGAEDLDPLGAKALSETAKIIVEKTTVGIGAFLGKVCMPAAEEFGLLLQDKVKSWRAANAAAVVEKARIILEQSRGLNDIHVHPRLAGKIIDKSSWVNEGNLQDMWAGIFASSCTPSGTEDSNLIFITLLDQLTAGEARLIEFLCKNARVHSSEHRLVLAETQTYVSLDGLRNATGIDSASELDIAIDHLREVGLLHMSSGFNLNSSPAPVATLIPSALCLNLFARTQGFTGDPYDFYEKGGPVGGAFTPAGTET